LGVIANKLDLSQIKPHLSQITLTSWQVRGLEAVKIAPHEQLIGELLKDKSKNNILISEKSLSYHGKINFYQRIGFSS
jgi:hypothetical protein